MNSRLRRIRLWADRRSGPPDWRQSILIREHGAAVTLEAAQRADAMLEKGDMEGAAVWRRVLKAVEELQRKERREGEAAH